jgi:Carboxypeptidase regulatory-like domain
MSSVRSVVLVLTCLFVAPAAALAQGSITGTVKDTSGAVLPGATVEAASPALIEKTRSAVTDSAGQYQILDLRPGVYTITFSLAGFSTVKREGIELTGSFVATVNGELKVGDVAETITVTGESPIVDLQTVTRQRVFGHDIADVIPTGRSQFNLAVLIPGVSTTGGQDVGGSLGTETNQLTVHGSKGNSQRITQNGISLGTLIADASMAGAVPNTAALQELTVDTSAVSADLAEGGVRVNIIPREGGNTFRGTLFASFANASMQNANPSAEITRRTTPGALTPVGNLLKRSYDVNPGFGGPILKDRLWFFASARVNVADNYAPGGIQFNANEGNPAVWNYVPDTTRGRPSNPGTWHDGTLRLTWQITPRNKLAASLDYQTRCTCPNGINATTAPEAGNWRKFPLQRSLQIDWTSPVSKNMMLEVSGIHRIERWGFFPLPNVDLSLIPVTDVGGVFPNLTYRGTAGGFIVNNSVNENFYYRAAFSYISGGHNMKIGFTDGMGYNDNIDQRQPISYTFNNLVPISLTERVTPFQSRTNVDHILGVYVQDKWTIARLTATYALRYDHFASSYAAQTLTPAPLAPTRNVSFPAGPITSWNDVTPRFGVSYDLFGNGKTALKATANRYLAGQGSGGLANATNPLNTFVSTATRPWTDGNRNYVPDCDLLNPALQDNRASGGDSCGAVNPLFGTVGPGSTYDPAVLTGWNHRDYNWEFSAGVQREILPRVSLDVGYFRRIYGNFIVTDNRAIPQGLSAYGAFTVLPPATLPTTAPSDATIPSGGGPFYDLNQAFVGLPSDNYVTFSKNYGKQIEHWDGVDVNVGARRGALQVQGGLSTGRTLTDNCDVLAQVPEGTAVGGLPGVTGALSLPYCHQNLGFLTQVKGFGSYLIPRIDVQVSGAFQSIPGPLVLANYTAVQAQGAIVGLGRPLANNATQVIVNLTPPGSLYGDRLNQLDLRIGKVIRAGRTRTVASLDLYNALNGNPILTQSNTYANWQAPQSVLTARFAKVSLQFDF